MERNLAEDLILPKTTNQEPESCQIKEDAEVRCMRLQLEGLGELVRIGDDDSSSRNAETEAPVYNHLLDSCVDFSDNEDRQQLKPNNQHKRCSRSPMMSVLSSERTNECSYQQQTLWGRDLPEVILRHIIQYLVQGKGRGSLPALFRIGGVCTLWRRISKSPIFWIDIDLSAIKTHQRTEETLRWFIYNRLKMCQHLQLSSWDLSDASVLSELASACPELTELKLFLCTLPEGNIRHFVLERFGKLERIDLRACKYFYFRGRPLYNTLKGTRTKLTHINLSYSRITGIPDVLSCLANHCRNLVILDLSCVSCDSHHIVCTPIEELQVGCPKLKVLRTNYSPLILASATHRQIETAPGFKELEELSVDGTWGSFLTDSCLLRIIGKSPKLKMLNVKFYEEITHRSLLQLPATDLEHLSTIGCAVTDGFGTMLHLVVAKWAHSLSYLNLSCAREQEPLNNALRVLAEKGAASPLEKLYISGSPVTLEPLKEILANCPLLNSINTLTCLYISDHLRMFANSIHEVNKLRDVLQTPLKHQSSLKLGEKYKPYMFPLSKVVF